VTNLVEELGDLHWYLALLMTTQERITGVNWETVLELNIAKLRKRYPNGVFDAEACQDRDVTAEQSELKQRIRTVRQSRVRREDQEPEGDQQWAKHDVPRKNR